MIWMSSDTVPPAVLDFSIRLLRKQSKRVQTPSDNHMRSRLLVLRLTSQC